jgi:hypothetical protein
LAVAACEDLKARIAAGLTGKGVSDFQLDIVANDAADPRAVVGRCEAGSKKILYGKGGTAHPPPAPRVPEASARAVNAVPVKPSPVLAPNSADVAQPSRGELVSQVFRDRLQQGGEGPVMVIVPAGEGSTGCGDRSTLSGGS